MQSLTFFSSSLNLSLHLPNKETLTSISHSPPNPRNPLALFNRRHLLLYVSISPSLLSLPIPAAARGLFQMPPPRLNNRYFLVRAGESEYERIGIINTNPVAKTSVDNGLSEEGKRQTARAAVELEAMGACEGDCWIWPSITQRSYQAAEIIAFVNGVNRSHIVPEYSFLDARGLGSYEGRTLDSITEAKHHDYWQKAMTEELNALEDTTRDIVPSPPDIHPVGCKWVIMLISSTMEPWPDI